MGSKALICYGVLGGIGLILIIVSMAGFAYFPIIVESEVGKSLDLRETDSEGYKNFVSILILKRLYSVGYLHRLCVYNLLQPIIHFAILGKTTCTVIYGL